MSISEIEKLNVFFGKDKNLTIRESDHVLRRFGELEIFSLEKKFQGPFVIRYEADEIFAVLSGELELKMVDLRENSPTFNETMVVQINELDSEAYLIIFGVAFSIKSNTGAKVLRLSTHKKNQLDQEISHSELDILFP